VGGGRSFRRQVKGGLRTFCQVLVRRRV
jgi:hypothetical protein